MKHSRAFTMIEVLAALALAALVMIALNQFAFGMGELWGKGGADRLFKRHVNAVTHHLQQMLENAAGSTEGYSEGEPIGVFPTRLENGGGGDLFGWELPGSDEQLDTGRFPRAAIVCSLEVVPRRGLLLYWRSRIDQDFANETSRAEILTPFCTRLEYDYYDGSSHTWRSSSGMEKDLSGGWRLPMRLRLHFEHEGLTADRTVLVPAIVRAGGLPAF
jgi:prepilin-type N-terminal cleavage/methylation domain-containing protein